MQIAGVIEGFYGQPWTWDERIEVGRWAAGHGLTDYVYAPKDDPKHRAQWRTPHDRHELDGFGRLATDAGVRLGYAISPGLSMDPDDAADRADLAAKVDQVVEVGAGLVVLALDDIPFGGGPQGEAHARLTTWLRDHLGERAALALVPTEYVGIRSTPYLDALAAGVPDDVPIGWTGTSVVPTTITAADTRARATALGGRSPLLWDNVTNDATMTDALPIGPVRGRDIDLRTALAGYLINPPLQPLAARLPIASAAGWLAGADPESAWEAAAEELGVRALAEACDGTAPRALVQAVLATPWPAPTAERTLAAETLVGWLDAVAACDAGALGDAAEPWVTQARREARLTRRALDLLDVAAGSEPPPVEDVLGVAARWGAARRSPVSVLGARYGVTPNLGQGPDGTWRVLPGAVIEGASAVDALVREALRCAGAIDAAPPTRG